MGGGRSPDPQEVTAIRVKQTKPARLLRQSIMTVDGVGQGERIEEAPGLFLYCCSLTALPQAVHYRPARLGQIEQ